MSQEEDLFAYDEDDAVRYILNVLPQELKENIPMTILSMLPMLCMITTIKRGCSTSRPEKK